MSRAVEFTADGPDRRHVTYIGQVVCRGPSNVVVLLTEPFNLAGRIVEIRIEDIVQERAPDGSR